MEISLETFDDWLYLVKNWKHIIHPTMAATKGRTSVHILRAELRATAKEIPPLPNIYMVQWWEAGTNFWKAAIWYHFDPLSVSMERQTPDQETYFIKR